MEHLQLREGETLDLLDQAVQLILHLCGAIRERSSPFAHIEDRLQRTSRADVILGPLYMDDNVKEMCPPPLIVDILHASRRGFEAKKERERKSCDLRVKSTSEACGLMDQH